MVELLHAAIRQRFTMVIVEYGSALGGLVHMLISVQGLASCLLCFNTPTAYQYRETLAQ
jgi:threonine/homoserine/homoserine lactone efflux protein